MARRLALLIGNQRFDDGSGFEPLKGPHNDVDALATVLRDPARGGFAEVRPLKDTAHRAMVQEVRRLLRQATAEDELLIHYSGHGQPDEEGRLFFAAVDSHAEELAATALRASDLQEWMAKSPARSVVLLLDCCFAGAFGKVLTGGLRGPHETGIQQQLREAVERARGRYILASSTSWQTSQESEGQADGLWMGHFTRAVVDRLNAEAGDEAGWVRFSHLAAHVRHAFAGHDPREFRADAEGDPGIAKVLARQTPAERAEVVLGRWWHEQQLSRPEFRALVALVTGDAQDPRTRRFVELLAEPDITPREVLIAWRGGSDAPSVSMRMAPPVVPPVAVPPPEPFPPRTPLARWREQIPGLAEAAWPDMVTLPAGVFTMGAPEGEEGSNDDERPRREVTVARPFALGRVALTFAHWDAAMAAGFVPASGPEPPRDEGWGRGDRPVINVSWEDAQAYCAWLNARLGLRPGTYRLPSEAEWEYACRAGTATPFSFGAAISPAQVNYDGNYTYGKGRKGEYRERTVPVGSLPANAWSLHEMHGNVWELCEDGYGPYPDHPTDSRPLTPADSSLRVLRGGSWYGHPSDCRSAFRGRLGPEDRSNDVGFRLARTLF